MASAARRLTSVFLVLALLVGAGPAQAQGTLTIDTLQIELWPEFDKPSTLVILTGTLAASASRPAEVTVHIPAAAGQPFAVAAQDSTGKLLNTPYEQAASGDTISITLKTDFPTFRVEYYDPLTIRGEARDYTFQWTTDYAVNTVNVRVQEPFEAQGLSSEPALAPSGAGDYGLNYYSASLGPLAAGGQVALRLKYSKPTATLSANAVGANAPAATPNVSTPSQPLELTPILLAAAVGIGLLLIGGGAYSWMRSKKEEGRAAQPGRPARRRRERRATRPTAPTSAASATAPSRFCTQCGHPLLTGDQFCRNCGAKMRDG